MSGRPAGRGHALWTLISLERDDRFTNGHLIRCHHPINHVFDWYRYPPVPATARGTCRGEGVGDTLSIGNSTTAGPIAFKFGVCLETSTHQITLEITFAQVRSGVNLHVRTCAPVFHISQTTGRIAFKFCV